MCNMIYINTYLIHIILYIRHFPVAIWILAILVYETKRKEGKIICIISIL